MAITKDISTITVDTTENTVTVTDNSTYTSPSRATCGVFLKLFKVDYAGNRSALETTGDGSGGNDDAEWVADYASDGWYQLAYVAIPDWAVTSYAIYDAVFRPSSGAVYRAKGAVSISVEADLDDTAEWEVITDPTSLCFNIGESNQSVNLNTITSIVVENAVLNALTLVAFGTQTGEAFLEASSNYKRSEDVRLYELLGLAVDGMTIANNRAEYSLGEIFARRAISLVP